MLGNVLYLANLFQILKRRVERFEIPQNYIKMSHRSHSCDIYVLKAGCQRLTLRYNPPIGASSPLPLGADLTILHKPARPPRPAGFLMKYL